MQLKEQDRKQRVFGERYSKTKVKHYGHLANKLRMEIELR